MSRCQIEWELPVTLGRSLPGGSPTVCVGDGRSRSFRPSRLHLVARSDDWLLMVSASTMLAELMTVCLRRI